MYLDYFNLFLLVILMIFSIEGYDVGRKDPHNALIIPSDEVEEEWREFFEHDPPENIPAKRQPILVLVTQKPAIFQSQLPQTPQTTISTYNKDHIINCSLDYHETLCVAYYNAHELYSRVKEKITPTLIVIKDKAVHIYEELNEIRPVRDFVIHFVISVVFFLVVFLVVFCFAPRHTKDSYRILVLNSPKKKCNINNRMNKI